MAERMTGLKRTHYCNDFRLSMKGETVVACGWVQKLRDKGGLAFIDLRDRTGVVQLTFDEHTDPSIMEKAKSCRSEFVVAAKGEVREREAKNGDIDTGDVELFVTDLRILSVAQTPPFHIDGGKVGEEIALKHRYLDLRRTHLQRNMKKRHDIAKVTRDYFYDNGFYEIETPMMMKSTPEGARDYLVPSRIHHGKFYALPQSPQIYKQLLMLSGYDRYIQLARCFRDEDLRADRQPEFTQIDLEMSFVDQDDIMAMIEGYFQTLFEKVQNTTLPAQFTRMTYHDAMTRYGSDKPDIRFGMEITDLSETVKDCDFVVFSDALKNGGSVRGIVAKGAADKLTRKSIDKLVEYVRGIGAKGLAYIRYVDDTPTCSFGKFLKEGELDAILSTLDCQKGDVALIVADKHAVTLPVLGSLRLTVAKQLELPLTGYAFLWITEFPFFEWDEDNQTFVAMHHPFTMPLEEDIAYLDSDKARVKAQAYDLVLNGTELLSGSIRITDYELQEKMFAALGLTAEEIEAKFGFLVEAYHYGAPPHGGAGIGLDRLAMILCEADSLRDVVAFPKMQNAGELMSECPATVDPKQLEELAIALALPQE